jgi:hypothetical protein
MILSSASMVLTHNTNKTWTKGGRSIWLVPDFHMCNTVFTLF